MPTRIALQLIRKIVNSIMADEVLLVQLPPRMRIAVKEIYQALDRAGIDEN